MTSSSRLGTLNARFCMVSFSKLAQMLCGTVLHEGSSCACGSEPGRRLTLPDLLLNIFHLAPCYNVIFSCIAPLTTNGTNIGVFQRFDFNHSCCICNQSVAIAVQSRDHMHVDSERRIAYPPSMTVHRPLSNIHTDKLYELIMIDQHGKNQAESPHHLHNVCTKDFVKLVQISMCVRNDNTFSGLSRKDCEFGKYRANYCTYNVHAFKEKISEILIFFLYNTLSTLRTCLDNGRNIILQEGSITCSEGQILCGDQSKCISKLYLCDGEEDCPNSSDEINCPTCRRRSVLCANGEKCIRDIHWCDGVKSHCKDGSDEAHCTGIANFKKIIV
ncbi:unnamed protein product, partial [Meganyctiphanes norvegica]